MNSSALRALAAALCVFGLSTQATQGASPAPQTPRSIAFLNGAWFTGQAFEGKTGYVIGGKLTFRKPARIDETVDLQGGPVVPPFGEAHNHNIDGLNNLDALMKLYRKHGIFYVKNPNSLARDRAIVETEINRPDTVDAVFSNGGLTCTGGHPAEIPARVIRTGKWTEADAEGAFFYAIDDKPDLDRKWPKILAAKPDFIKTYLLYSGDYARRKGAAHFEYWRGLDPRLLPLIVGRAHRAGLRVSTHIEDAVDFHNALVAGVDEINHMPGFRAGTDVDQHNIAEFELSESDAELAARQGTYVVTTLWGSTPGMNADQLKAQNALNSRNLELLLKHGVKVALGSDAYRADTLPEALYIHSLGVVDNRTLLNMWCTTTAETIFPHRRIGRLQEGYEASFLVLRGNPLKDFAAVESIALEMKEGQIQQYSQLDSKLRLEVFVAPEEGWRVVSTLIVGPTESILVDTEYHRSDALKVADRIAASGTHLKAIIITHAHDDHYMGAGTVCERFPGTPVYLRAEGMELFKSSAPGVIAWLKKNLPAEAPPGVPDIQPLTQTSLTVDGETVEIRQGQGDESTTPNTYLWIPSLRAVVAGDIIFNQVHVWLASSDERSRAAWLKSLADLASLNPLIVVAGHKKNANTPDSPDAIAFTRRYIEDFEAARRAAKDADGLIAAMKAKYPDLGLQEKILPRSARQAFAKGK